MFKILKSIDSGVEKFSSFLLVIFIMTILTFSLASIFFRWFGLSFHWIEPLVRHLVFFCAFLGGVLATGKGSHIGIDLLTRYLEGKKYKKLQDYLLIFSAIFSSALCFWLVSSCSTFIKMELEYGKVVFWGIHSGVLVMIIPFGFLMISYRFFFLAVKALYDLKKITLENN